MARPPHSEPRREKPRDIPASLRESQGPRFDVLTDGVRGRAAQWNAAGELLAAAVASRPRGDAPAERHSRPARAMPPSRQARSRAAGRSAARGAGRGAGRDAGRSAAQAGVAGGVESTLAAEESWRRRQLELLARIDENIRRMRELQESSRPPQSAFTDPAY